MANAFSSLLGIGGGGTNRIGNALTGFSTAIERGLEDPQVRDARAAQEQQAEAQKQAAQFKFIQSSAAFLDTLSPQQQKAYLDINGPLFVEQGVLDEEDLPILYQNVGVPNGFTGLARSAIDPNQQQQNVFEGQKIAEQGRANRVGEGLRGAEVDLSRQRLGLDRERFAEDRRQFNATQAAKAPAASQAARAFGDRQQRVQLITSTIDKAIEQVGPLSAGVVGASLDDPGGVLGAPRRALFGQGAANLRATIDTVAANIGFEELQRLRDNSPTGGALGQVTERELQFLQSALASLSQDQEPKQLKARLRTVKDQIIQSWDRVEAAYRQDFGAEQPQGATAPPPELLEFMTPEERALFNAK